MSENKDFTNPLALANEPPLKRMLTATNFEVRDVKKINGKGLGYNTEVTILIDTHDGKDVAAEDRYGERYLEHTHRITRIDLKDALDAVGIQRNPIGVYLSSFENAQTLVNIAREEVLLRNHGALTVAQVKADSLGYTGTVTFDVQTTNPDPEPEVEPEVPTNYALNGPVTMYVGQTSRYTLAVEPTALMTKITDVVFTLQDGSTLTQNTFAEFTANEVGTGIITVTFKIDGLDYTTNIEYEVLPVPIEVPTTYSLTGPATVEFGQSIKFDLKIEPATALAKATNIVYTLADGTNVQGTTSAEFTPTQVGNGTITVSFDVDGQTYSTSADYEVTPVAEIPTTYNLEGPATFNVGETATFTLVVEPTELLAKVTDVVYTLDDDSEVVGGNSVEVIGTEPDIGVVSVNFKIDGIEYTTSVDYEVLAVPEVVDPEPEPTDPEPPIDGGDGGDPEPQPLPEIAVEEITATGAMTVGTSVDFALKLEPVEIMLAASNLVWSVNNADILEKVDSARFLIKTSGTVMVTASYDLAGEPRTVTLELVIEPEEVLPPPSVTLEGPSSGEVGKAIDYVYNVSPISQEWDVEVVNVSSTNEDVLIYEGMWRFRVVGAGQATIVMEYKYNGETFFVEAPFEGIVVPVTATGFFIEAPTEVEVYDLPNIKYVVEPANADIDEIIWQSSNPDALMYDAETNTWVVQAYTPDLIEVTLLATSNGQQFVLKAHVSVTLPNNALTDFEITGDTNVVEGTETGLAINLNPVDTAVSLVAWDLPDGVTVEGFTKNDQGLWVSDTDQTSLITEALFPTPGMYIVGAWVTDVYGISKFNTLSVNIEAAVINPTEVVITAPEEIQIESIFKAITEILPADAQYISAEWVDPVGVTHLGADDFRADVVGEASITYRVTLLDGAILDTTHNFAVIAKPWKDLLGITIDGPTEVEVGDVIQVTVTPDPLDATITEGSFATLNGNIVDITNDGAGGFTFEATALEEGILTVEYNATDPDGPQYKASHGVTIVKPVIHPDIFEMNGPTNVMVGDLPEYSVNIEPEGVIIENARWSSTNQNVIALVNGAWEVLGAGTATIKYTFLVDGTEYVAEIDVVAELPPPPVIDIESLIINGESNLLVGEVSKYTAVIQPANATIENITWSVSGDGSILALKDGTESNFTPKSAGTETVTVTVITPKGPVTATIDVIVTLPTVPLDSVVITGPIEVEIGDDLVFGAMYNPENPDLQSVEWDYGDLIVETDGVLYAIAEGMAVVTITATDMDGNTRTDDHVVIIKRPIVNPTDFEIVGDLFMIEGDVNEFGITTTPPNADVKSVIFEEVTVDGALGNMDDAEFTAITAGKAEIRATVTLFDDSQMVKSVFVTIALPPAIPVTEISIDGPEMIYLEDTAQMSVNYTPADADVVKVEWVSNTSAIGIDDNGLITGLVIGSSSIEVTTTDRDGGVMKAIKGVRVERHPIEVETIEFTTNTTTLKAGYGGFTFNTLITPDNADIESIVYSIDNENLTATSSPTYWLATTVGKSTAKVTVTSKTGKVITKTLAVEVINNYTSVTSVSLRTPSERTIVVGEPTPLEVTFSPTNAHVDTITFLSDKPEFISVTEDGKFLAHAHTDTWITVRVEVLDMNGRVTKGQASLRGINAPDAEGWRWIANTLENPNYIENPTSTHVSAFTTGLSGGSNIKWYGKIGDDEMEVAGTLYNFHLNFFKDAMAKYGIITNLTSWNTTPTTVDFYRTKISNDPYAGRPLELIIGWTADGKKSAMTENKTLNRNDQIWVHEETGQFKTIIAALPEHNSIIYYEPSTVGTLWTLTAREIKPDGTFVSLASNYTVNNITLKKASESSTSYVFKAGISIEDLTETLGAGYYRINCVSAVPIELQLHNRGASTYEFVLDETQAGVVSADVATKKWVINFIPE